jgi:hypothetical protein
MPEIIVTAGVRQDEQTSVLLRERVTVQDLESGHFSAQLVQRVGWAVLDADEIECRSDQGDRHAGAADS